MEFGQTPQINKKMRHFITLTISERGKIPFRRTYFNSQVPSPCSSRLPASSGSTAKTLFRACLYNTASDAGYFSRDDAPVQKGKLHWPTIIKGETVKVFFQTANLIVESINATEYCKNKNTHSEKVCWMFPSVTRLTNVVWQLKQVLSVSGMTKISPFGVELLRLKKRNFLETLLNEK